MNKRGQQNVIEWAVTAVFLLVYLYVFFQIGKAFCSADNSFCGYFASVLAAFVAGIVLFLRYGNRR
jgi:hypothetical protein